MSLTDRRLRRMNLTFSNVAIARDIRDSATSSGMVPSAYVEKWMTYALQGPHALDIAFRQRLAEVEIDCKRLTAERDEADRRAGAAERLLKDTADTLSKMQAAIRTRKRDAGYSEVTSFDVVWAEVLEKAKMIDRFRNDNKHHHHMTPLQPVTDEEQWRFGSIYSRAELAGEFSASCGEYGQWRTLHAPGHSGFALVVWRGADDEDRTPEYEERARAMLDTLNWVEARPKATADAEPASGDTTPCPTCGAPCNTTVAMRGGDHGWGTSDLERTRYSYAAPQKAEAPLKLVLSDDGYVRGIRTDYQPLYDFAKQKKVSFAELCAAFLETVTPELELRAQTQANEVKPVWRCFHCDECFDTVEAAKEHFGPTERQQPACSIDIKEYRAMEQRMIAYNDEDAAIHREMHSKLSDHQLALVREEERGYAKGLKDAKRHPADLGLQKIAPQWIHIHNNDYLVFSRSDWAYPDSVEGDAGQRDASRYASIDHMDGDIVVRLSPGGYKDNEHLAIMLQTLWAPKK